MKKILLSVLTIALVATVAIGATQALFSDTEESTGNTFTAGTLDLQVDGNDSIVPFAVTNMVPGERRGSTTYQICNVGSIPGKVTMQVDNVISEENSVIEPEESANDANGTRLDPDNYTIAVSGEGELLDQVVMRFWVDDTPGQRPAAFDWQDRYWEGYPDESGTYHLVTGAPISLGNGGLTLQPNTCGYMGVTTTFIDDTNAPYGWILDGVANNAAMGDGIKFDLTVGLEQLTP